MRIFGLQISRDSAKKAATSGTESGSVNKGRYPWEFWLVMVMLTALVILILMVLRPSIVGTVSPPNLVEKTPVGADGKPVPFEQVNVYFERVTAYNDMMLSHRKDILAIIITAFGAWVGAGAAYFFGRENLRVSADSLLAMRNMSAKERLRQTSIKQMPPTPLEWVVKKNELIATVQSTLIAKPEYWFIPIVDEITGRLITVINEEAVWRYMTTSSTTPPISPLPPTAPVTTPISPIQPPALPATPNVPIVPTVPLTPPATATVQDLLNYINVTPALRRFSQVHVTVTMDTTVGAANELMDSQNVFLAIVETDGKPTHFFTTSEVRKLLLQS